jgi:hypothetical protein
MADGTHLRISDQDREQAAAALREHFAAGRLDSAEFEDRLQAIYAARTRGELDALSADLPTLPVTAAQARAVAVQQRSQIARRAMQNAGGSFTPFLVCTGIWAASGANSFFWPVFLLIPTILMVVRVGWALYGPAPDLEAAEREIRSHHRDHRDRHHHDHGRREDQ